MSKNVLVVGSGAREHAIAWKLAQSPRIGTIYCAPGNPGTAEIAENLDIDVNDAEGMWQAIERHAIDLTIVGPEDPLANGIADVLRERGQPVFGPSRAGARIESSKAWAKEIMQARAVPTGQSVHCDSLEAALDTIYDAQFPLVLKADGLAAGKGVVICQDRAEAETAVRAMMQEKSLGDAGTTVLIEEFLSGMEVSLLAVTDGERVVPLLPACDYKPLETGDRGPNTGGMGAYTPPAVADQAWVTTLLNDVFLPVLAELRDRGIDYRGVLYAGVILTETGPKVLEFNCRFGDPETQVILPMLKTDFLDLCDAAARGDLTSMPPLEWHAGACVGVVLAAGGYPGSYRKGDPISGLDSLPEGGIVFQAGTAFQDGNIVTNGGRVLTAVGRGPSMAAARELAYRTAQAVTFPDSFHREDIALREITSGCLRRRSTMKRSG